MAPNEPKEKQMKITASIRKALETLAQLIDGKLEGCTKPSWGWDSVRIMLPTEVTQLTETQQEPSGHGKIDYVEVPTGERTRSVAFWMSQEMHLATIHLYHASDLFHHSKKDEGWQVVGVDFDVLPQHGCRAS